MLVADSDRIRNSALILSEHETAAAEEEEGAIDWIEVEVLRTASRLQVPRSPVWGEAEAGRHLEVPSS